MNKSTVIIVAAAIAIMAAGLLAATCLGAKNVPVETVVDSIFNFRKELDMMLVRDSRLPRALCSALVGGLLAMTGAMMQGITKNAIAEPSIMGITQGAVFAVAIVSVSSTVYGIFGYPNLHLTGDEGKDMSHKKWTRIVVISSLFLLLTVTIIALMYGSYTMSFRQVVTTLLFGGDKSERLAIWGIRLPRTLVAIFIGLALSASGCIMQGVTHNPLAEPGIIGVNAGATLAVVTFISFRSEAYYSALGMGTLLLTPLFSICGAFAASLLILLLTRKNCTVGPNRLVLVGLGVGIAINAFTTLMQLSMSRGNYNQALAWTNGSLWGSGFVYLAMIVPPTLIVFAILIFKGKTLDVMGLGDEIAVGLGVNVESERGIFLVLAVLLAAGATAVAGNITFVGLIGPHIAQRLVGPAHRRKLPVAAIIGASLIVLVDALARNVFSPIEIPVGIVISLVGVPYFIYLMLKEK